MFAQDEIILLAIGFFAGTLGGMLGIGGSIIMIPAMTIVFGTHQHLYQGAAMIANFFVAIPSAIQHRKAGAILGPIVRRMIPWAVVGVAIGVAISACSWFHGRNQVYLARLFGCFLLYDASYHLYRLWRSRVLPDMDHQAAQALPRWKTGLAVGLPTGLIGGLLGIGGGTVCVPLQQFLLRVPLRRAIANSAATIVPLSLLGAITKNYTNLQEGIPLSESLYLASLLVPTACIGGYLGSAWTHKAPRKLLRVVFSVLMLYAAVNMLTRSAPAPDAPAQSLRSP